MIPRWVRAGLALGSILFAAASPLRAAAPPTRPQEQDSAARVDDAFRRALGAAAAMPPVADDETFLRRASLDLTGRLPTSEEVRRWAGERGPDRRNQLVDRLLASEAHAVNWARYWRDTVTYHTPASNNYLRWPLFNQWWVEQFRRNRPWDQVVTALVTADGINDEV